MSTLQERIAEIMTETGKTVGELAKVAQVSSSAVTQWKDGPTQSLKIGPASKLEAATGYMARWIATGQGPKLAQNRSNIIALHPDEDVPEGMVQVPEYKIHFSGGAGSVVIDYELQEEMQPATYRLSWLQEQRLSLKYLRRFKVTGDSMEPLLFDGDTILVNTAENGVQGLREGKVYAIRYDDELRVKRLYRRLDGTLILRSDNPDYEDESVPPELVQEHITIIGRVREKSGSGGL